jgi:hypothetical protein
VSCSAPSSTENVDEHRHRHEFASRDTTVAIPVLRRIASVLTAQNYRAERGASRAQAPGMHRLVGFALCAALAASSPSADANSCNLYQPQSWGQIRVGCSLTVFALPDVDPGLPDITRAGTPVVPTIDHDQLTLKVTMQHYPSPDSCNLVTSYENRTFDRYVLTWSDLQPGDEIEVDGQAMTVPGPGDCGVVDPLFYCQDGVQDCHDYDGHDYDDPQPGDADQAGCSVGSGSASWLVIVSAVAIVGFRRRSRRSARR